MTNQRELILAALVSLVAIASLSVGFVIALER